MKPGLVLAPLACALALAWSAPLWLDLRDPAAQPDTLVLRNLPPLSRVEAIRLADGSLRYAHEIRFAPDGAVEIRRGEARIPIPRESLAPGSSHRIERFWLGTDEFGRDILSRLAHGARVSLAVGLLAAAVALSLGTLVGLAAGLGGGAVDAVLMRATDAALAVPKLFLLLLLVTIRGPSATLAVIAVGATTWMATARVVRAQVLTLERCGFVEAARAQGAGPVRLALVHLGPALVPTWAAEGALRVGQAILLESSLSFLGLVVPPPNPTWGNMIAEGRSRLHDAWWIATFPGVAIASTVLAIHAAGEWVRHRTERSGTFGA